MVYRHFPPSYMLTAPSKNVAVVTAAGTHLDQSYGGQAKLYTAHRRTTAALEL